MIDLASYGLTAQSFEFLCTLAPNATDIAPGLALSAGPRTPTTQVWTFKLRQGVKWQDGNGLHVGRRGRHDGAPGRRG